MRKFFLLGFSICSCLLTSAQKSVISIEDCKQWTTVHSGKISDNGKFVSYHVNNDTSWSRKLVIQATGSTWKEEFQNASEEVFALDGKVVIFKRSLDALQILFLEDRKSIVLSDVTQFQVSKHFVIYRTKKTDELCTYEILTGRAMRFNSVISVQIAANKDLAIFTTKDSSEKASITLLQLGSTQQIELWKAETSKQHPESIIFDGEGSQIAAFITESNIGNHLVWCYNLRSRTGYVIVTDAGVQGKYCDLRLHSRDFRFSKNQQGIFVSLEKPVAQKLDHNSGLVDVWSYNDSVLQSLQIVDKNKKLIYAGFINIPEKSIWRLEAQNEKILSEGGDYVLVEKQLGLLGRFESMWNTSAQANYSLVSLKDGNRTLLKEKVDNDIERPHLSPDGKWIVCYDINRKNYSSYETMTGKIRDITGDTIKWEDEYDEYPRPILNGWPFWINDSVLIGYDNYDVWLLDARGKRNPSNITNGYGRKNLLKFSLLFPSLEVQALSGKKDIFLEAFDINTKQRGYFSIRIGRAANPQLLCMGNYVYGEWERYSTFHLPPIKALNKDLFLDFRANATEAPNYFLTSDYKRFTFLSDVRPQEKFNWYTNELHTWRSLDGTTLQGVLYKPKTFDSTKRYPVLFQYYEKRSERLNLFLRPDLSEGEFNIPYVVSRDYLVFVPDIHYDIGRPGESAYNSVVSAARYLSTMSWVDPKRMGLQGHSFGGYETGSIITRTNFFAAACAASGIYDLMGMYGSGYRGGFPMYHAEIHQAKMGGTPWSKQELYIDNSPIYSADQVSTPFLMVQNKDDRVVPFHQGVEFFTSLRRLGKRAWMLQYDGEEHSLVSDEKASIDFTIRMMQFFDHYLKDSACPKWMLYGIAAKDKGIDDGLELVREKDANGKWLTPPEGGLLTTEEKKKVEALKNRKPVTIQLK